MVRQRRMPALVATSLIAMLMIGVSTACTAYPGRARPVDPRRSEVQTVVASALAAMKQVFALPRGMFPGSVDPSAIASMRANALAMLSLLYTGPLLDSRLALVDRALAQEADPKMGPLRDGGARDLAFTSVVIDGDHATVTGTYTSWFLGEDPTSPVDPQREQEITAPRRFEVTLVRIGDAWFITSEDIS